MDKTKPGIKPTVSFLHDVGPVVSAASKFLINYFKTIPANSVDIFFVAKELEGLKLVEDSSGLPYYSGNKLYLVL